MASEQAHPAQPAEQLNLYDLWIGILTLLSLTVMAFQILLPKYAPAQSVLFIEDNLFCLIFLADFFGRLIRAPSKRDYLVWEGIIDFLGSIPAIPALRVFRVFRLARVARLLHIGGPGLIFKQFLERRAESALYITLTLVIVLLLVGSTVVLAVESRDPDANILTGQDAIWWSMVTVTTVGYGDRFPVTWPGRMIGMFMMAVGIGIFGVITSFLANAFLSAPKPAQTEATDEAGGTSPRDELVTPAQFNVTKLETEVNWLRAELAEIKALLKQQQNQ
jgi:voltage-gated potassium channel